MSGNNGPTTNILQPWTPQQQQANDQASAAIRSMGERFTQQIYFPGAFVPIMGQPTVVNVPVNNVGLITKFWVEVSTVITNPGGGNALTRGSFGPWSQLSLINYVDPLTNNRISTTGWHLASVMARRHRRIPGAAYTTDSPAGFGSVIPAVTAPASIAAGASGTVRCVYEVPLSIGKHSLKGAVFAGAVFATQNLQLTVNPNLVQAGSNPLAAGYTGAATGANAPTMATTITVYYDFWDGFPLSLLASLAPDLSTVYEIKTTSITPLIANQDNYVRYTNLRTFLSTVLAFDNNGTLNAGTDINYFKLLSANQTIRWQKDAYLHSYQTRNHFGDDWPAGTYMFDSSEDPIITAAEGNTVLAINPSTVNAGAVLYVGWEDLAVSQVLASAPSLAGNAGASGR